MEFSLIVLTILLLGIFPLLFRKNVVVRFYTKTFLHNANLVLSHLLAIPIALLRPFDVRNTNYAMFFLRHMSKMFDITWNVKGVEHLRAEEAAVVVCNHQSSLDIVAVSHLWPDLVRAAPVAKRELLFTGPFGLMNYLSGTVFVDRSNPAKARATLNNAIDYLTAKKTKLLIFPEGTRNQESEGMLPFKKGAFHMALQAQVPIVPVVISSYSSFYDKKMKKFENGGKVTIQILPPVPTKGLTVADMDSLIASVRNPMVESYNTLSGFKQDTANNKNSANMPQQ